MRCPILFPKNIIALYTTVVTTKNVTNKKNIRFPTYYKLGYKSFSSNICFGRLVPDDAGLEINFFASETPGGKMSRKIWSPVY